MKKFGETRKRKGQNESDTGDEKQGRSSSEKVGFIWEKLEHDFEFRSEGLQEEKNERDTQERQHNHIMIQNQ